MRSERQRKASILIVSPWETRILEQKLPPLERLEGRDFTERPRFQVNSGNEQTIYQRDGRMRICSLQTWRAQWRVRMWERMRVQRNRVRFMGRCSGRCGSWVGWWYILFSQDYPPFFVFFFFFGELENLGSLRWWAQRRSPSGVWAPKKGFTRLSWASSSGHVLGRMDQSEDRQGSRCRSKFTETEAWGGGS